MRGSVSLRSSLYHQARGNFYATIGYALLCPESVLRGTVRYADISYRGRVSISEAVNNSAERGATNESNEWSR